MLAELLVTFSVLYYCTLLLQPNAIKKKACAKKLLQYPYGVVRLAHHLTPMTTSSSKSDKEN